MGRTKRGLSYSSQPDAKKQKLENGGEELLPFIHMKKDLQNKLESQLKEYTTFYGKPGHKHIDRELIRLHKKIGEEIHDLHKELEENWPKNQNFDLEIAIVVKTVAFAILNPMQTEWDVTRFADSVKNTRVHEDKEAEADLRLPLYFRQAEFGKLTTPATILDMHGRVMVWALPGILNPKRLDYYKATRGLEKRLIHSRNKKTWRAEHFISSSNPVFEHGIVDFSPGWFAKHQERLQDPIHVSAELQPAKAAKFIKRIHHVEGILNCIGMLICPEMFSAGAKAIKMLKEGTEVGNKFDNVQLWPSFFSGLEVIANRKTPYHRDAHSAPAMYDFLVSAGNHSGTWFSLPDIKTRLLYNPGTVTAISGKVLRHAVLNWQEGKERLCIAHFMRDRVHDRLSIPRPDWVTDVRYLEMMDPDFIKRQEWVAEKEEDI